MYLFSILEVLINIIIIIITSRMWECLFCKQIKIYLKTFCIQETSINIKYGCHNIHQYISYIYSISHLIGSYIFGNIWDEESRCRVNYDISILKYEFWEEILVLPNICSRVKKKVLYVYLLIAYWNKSVWYIP